MDRTTFANQTGAVAGYAEQQMAGDAMPKLRDVPQLQRDLSEITAHVEQMTTGAAKVANELFGPPPPQVVGPAEGILNQSGAVGELHMLVERLRRQLADLYGQMQRFDTLV